ncbi:MAG: Magnesium and cobalt efflux protein CorC [candidate division BRC1 bacterium ADurb.BinA364]|nr:MAG: Magnesium and cobalt efflux protein CorC [candidate division BRC1 bacterium ADurb.BinA364]
MSPETGLAATTAFTLILSHICSLFEACFMAVPLTYAKTRAEKGAQPWKLVVRLKVDPDRPISGILITNTIANTAGATLAGSFAEQVFDSWGYGIFTAALVLGILWFSEIIPKTIGVIFAARLAPIAAYPIQGLVMFWKPLIFVLERTTRIIKNAGRDAPTVTDAELAFLARQGAAEGQLRGHEALLIEKALALDKVRARDLMTPRTVCDMLADDMPLEQAAAEALHWRHSRLPVHRAGAPDEIYGLCLRRDVFDTCIRGEAQGKTIADIASNIFMAPEGASGHSLLEQFLEARQHLAAVINEYGDFLGIVTLEDVLEFLLGKEIVDEYDAHDDMQAFALDRARSRGMPIAEAENEETRRDSRATDE